MVAIMAALVYGANTRAQGLHNGAGSPINPGDVIIYRVGDNGETPTNIGNAVYLDEYTAASIAAAAPYSSTPTIYQTIEMPTNWAGGEAPLIFEGSEDEGGLITLSVDGRFLLIPGYAALIGQCTNPAFKYFPGVSTNQTLDAPTTNAVTLEDIPRVYGLLDGKGHVYLSTTITNVDDDVSTPYSAASLDGTNIWTSSYYNIVKYTTRGSLVSTQLVKNGVIAYPTRSVVIAGGTNAYANTTSAPVLWVDRNQSIFWATNTSFAVTVVSTNCTTTNSTPSNCTNVYTYTTVLTGCVTNRSGCLTNLTGCTTNSVIITNQPYCTTNYTYSGCVYTTNSVPLNPFGGALPVYQVVMNFALVPSILQSSGLNALESANGFVFFNLANKGPTPGAPDTVYIADGFAVGFPGEPIPRGGGLLKYCWVQASNAWISVATMNNEAYVGGVAGEDAYSVTGVKNSATNNSSVTLYFTEATNAVLYNYTDTTGYGGNPQDAGDGGVENFMPLWNDNVHIVRGVAMAPQGGDSGTLSTAPYGLPSVGPPYAPYFRGPQGGPFQPASGYTYSIMNPYPYTALWSVSGNSFETATPSSGSLPANGGSATFTITPNASVANGENGGLTYTESLHFNLAVETNPSPPYANSYILKIATLVVDAFYVVPTTNFVSVSTSTGGPFSPLSTIYALSNSTPGTLSWSAFTSNTWDSLSASSGTLGGGQTTNITVSIVPSVADAIPYFGTYDDYIVFSNVTAGSQVATSPEIFLQVGFGIHDDFGDAGEFTNGNVVGQSSWRSDNTFNPVQITGAPNNGVFVVPGGCPNAGGSSQQPYKYVSATPLTNPCASYTTNIVGCCITQTFCNPVQTYAITGVLITFTNAPPTPNYVFEQGTPFLAWNDAGILAQGGGYVWTTELNQYETGGGPKGSTVYNFNQQYQVFMITDFQNSNAWVFVNPGSSNLQYVLSSVSPAVHATGGDTGCTYCQGVSPQGWESIVLGQYSSCSATPSTDAEQPGYWVNRVAASTNYADVYGYIMAGLSAPPVASFTNNPSCGSTPIAVNFYDTSSGSPSSWQWDSGDCSYSYVQNPTFVYTNPGTYYPSLIALSQSGPSTSYVGTVTVPCAAPPGGWGAWDSYYFPNGGSLSGPNVDVYGTGMSNTNKFFAGFSGTNAAAYLHIISTAKTNGNINVTYLGASGDTNYPGGPSVRTNVLEYTTGTANGSYQNSSWTQVPGATNILGAGQPAPSGGTGQGSVTNMTDVGGASATPSRYYRIRVLLP